MSVENIGLGCLWREYRFKERTQTELIASLFKFRLLFPICNDASPVWKVQILTINSQISGRNQSMLLPIRDGPSA
jgi:hypothetical protein